MVRGRRPPRGQVVADQQPAVLLDAGQHLVELQREQPAVGAELDDEALDLVGDAPHHLQPLADAHRVADGDEVLDLEGRQRAGDLVEAQLVALERGQRLVGAREDRRRVLEGVPPAGHVDADDVHRLAHRDDREAGLQGDPLGGAVPGAGLLGGDGRVGHEVHAGAHDARAVVGDDHRAVHLGQLAQPGGRQRDVQREAAGAQRLDHPVVAEHDQRARAAGEDALQPVAQRRSRGDAAEEFAQRDLGVHIGGHERS